MVVKDPTCYVVGDGTRRSTSTGPTGRRTSVRPLGPGFGPFRR